MPPKICAINRIKGRKGATLFLPPSFGSADERREWIAQQSDSITRMAAEILANGSDYSPLIAFRAALEGERKNLAKRLQKEKARATRLSKKAKDKDRLEQSEYLIGCYVAQLSALEGCLFLNFSKPNYTAVEVADFLDRLLLLERFRAASLLRKLDPRLRLYDKLRKVKRNPISLNDLRNQKILSRYKKLRAKGMSQTGAIKEICLHARLKPDLKWPCSYSHIFEIIKKET